jgi:hypothetical protein
LDQNVQYGSCSEMKKKNTSGDGAKQLQSPAQSVRRL